MQTRASFANIWKRALGTGDKAVAIVSLLKTAREIEKESLEIKNFIKSQIATGRLSKNLGSHDQIMTIWARSTNDFADPFTPEAATLISEVSSRCPTRLALYSRISRSSCPVLKEKILSLAGLSLYPFRLSYCALSPSIYALTCPPPFI